MGFGGTGGGGSASIATSTDAALSNPSDGQILAYDGSIGKWKNAVSAGGGGANSLGRVRYASGWPVSRPSGYTYIDWIKSSPTDPDPSAGIMVAGDTISEWQ